MAQILLLISIALLAILATTPASVNAERKLIEVVPIPASVAAALPLGKPVQRAVRVNDFVKLNVVRGFNPANNLLVSGGIVAQAAQAVANVRAILAVAGCSLNNVDYIVIRVNSSGSLAAVRDALTAGFDAEGATVRAAGEIRIVDDLYLDALVEFVVEAVNCDAYYRVGQIHQVVPVPASVYTSPAVKSLQPVVRVNDFVKLSAVRGINLLTGALVSGGAAGEATQAIANVRALLDAAGCSLKDVVSISSFVQNTNDLPAAVAAVTAAFAADGLPIRNTGDQNVFSSLFGGALVEYVVEAANCGPLFSQNDEEKTVSVIPIPSSVAVSSILGSSRVVRVNNFLKLIAVRGVNMQTGNLVSGGVANEAAQAISNVRALLNVAGCSLNNVVQMSGRLIDTADVPTLDLAWKNGYTAEGAAVSTKCPSKKNTVRALLNVAGVNEATGHLYVVQMSGRLIDTADVPTLDLAWKNGYTAEGAATRAAGELVFLNVLRGGAKVEILVQAANCRF